nr:hypothetical protein [Tanacetum cinerariifolium]
MNMGQDRQMQMIGAQNVGNQVAQNPRVQNDGNQNQIGNGNIVAVRAEGNAVGNNRNQIRCYNCRGLGHFARDCTEADDSLAKHKAMELDNERLLKAVKLENANVELEFQVFNYARENAHLKTTYKNLFDSIFVLRVQTETKIASLQNELQNNIYKNAKLRTQLFKKVSDQKDNTQNSRVDNTKTKRPQPRSNTKNDRVPLCLRVVEARIKKLK